MLLAIFLETKCLFVLVLPILVSQLAQVGIGVTDIAMAGHYSVKDLAAVALGTNIWILIFLTLSGFLFSLLPFIARFHGANDAKSITYFTRQGIWMGVSMATLAVLLGLFSAHFLLSNLSELNLDTLNIAKNYLYAVLCGLPALFLFISLKEFTDGIGYTKIGMIVSIMGLLINVPLNYIFVYGKFGIPAMGGIGCGIASSITMWAMFFSIAILVHISPKTNTYRIFKGITYPHINPIREIFKLGAPISLTLFFEIGFYVVIALFVTRLGDEIVAAHQIGFNYYEVLYTMPIAFSLTLTIRVGYLLGANNLIKAFRVSCLYVCISFIIVLITVVATLFFAKSIVSIYTNDVFVYKNALPLISLVGIFIGIDILNMSFNGILRAFKDTKTPAIITFICYWLLGIPVSYMFALTNIFGEKEGLIGFWKGIFVSLIAMFILYLIKTIKVFQDAIKRERETN